MLPLDHKKMFIKIYYHLIKYLYIIATLSSAKAPVVTPSKIYSQRNFSKCLFITKLIH